MTETTQRDELRERITRAIVHAPNGLAAAEAVLAERAEELEELRAAHDLMCAQFRVMQQEKDHGWREAAAAEAEAERLRGLAAVENEACRDAVCRANTAEAEVAEVRKQLANRDGELAVEQRARNDATAKLAKVHDAAQFAARNGVGSASDFDAGARALAMDILRYVGGDGDD